MATMRALDHIAIAVLDLDAAVTQYRERLGANLIETETVESQGVRLAKLDVGGVTIELFQALDPESRIGRSIAKRGAGIHHLAFAVDDVDATLEEYREADVPLVDEHARPGSANSRVAFLRPEALAGALVEVVEPDRAKSETGNSEESEGS